MFKYEDLLANIAHPTRKPAHPKETPSSTGKEHAGTQPASTRITRKPPAGVGALRVMRVDAGKVPARANNVQDGKNPNHAGLRVGSGVCGIAGHFEARTAGLEVVRWSAPPGYIAKVSFRK